MGNVLRKPPKSEIDGGSTTTNSLRRSIDFKEKLVEKYIRTRRLAPFYHGEDEPKCPDPTSSNEAMNKKRRKHFFRRESVKKRPEYDQFLNTARTECPICFLYYPENINKTSCCHQSICTDCFVNLKILPKNRCISCPFCNQKDLKVEYRPPNSILNQEQIEVNPVSSSHVKPYIPPSTPRRLYSNSPYYVPNGSRPSHWIGNHRGSVVIFYDDAGRRIQIQRPSSSRFPPQVTVSQYYNARRNQYSNRQRLPNFYPYTESAYMYDRSAHHQTSRQHHSYGSSWIPSSFGPV